MYLILQVIIGTDNIKSWIGTRIRGYCVDDINSFESSGDK